MKYGEILKLLEAGYTRDEINAMREEEINSQQEEPEEPAENTQQEAAPAMNDQLSALLNRIEARLTDLQAANIYAQQQPQEEKHKMTDVEALEELIRPKRFDKKGE